MSRPRKHIIYVCQAFYPDSQATSQLYKDLLMEVAEEPGVRVTVLCGFPSGFREGAGDVPRYERLGNVEVHRCGLRVGFKKSMRQRTISYLGFLTHVFWRLLRARRSDLVFGVTTPPFLAIVLWAVSRLGRIEYQYFLHDLHPDGLFAEGTMDPRSPGARLWMWLNGLAYKRARRLIVLGRDMIGFLKRTYDIGPERIVYMPNWSVMEAGAPLAFADSAPSAALKLSEKFVVQYSGNMGLWHDIDILVQAAALLREDRHIQFLFIGEGMRRRAAEELSQRLGLTNVTWLKFVPREHLRESLACCHVSIVSMRAGLSGVAVPSKIYGILASGRAVLAQVPADSEAALVTREEKCGVVVEPGKVEELVAAIRALAMDPEGVAAMGRRAFAAYEAKYTRRAAKAAFERLCE